MDIVFNELSIKETATPNEIQQWISLFLSNCKILIDVTKRKLDLISSINLMEIQFDGYSIKQYLSVQKKDDKLFLLKLLTNKPLLHDYPYYYYNNLPCKGFAFTYETKGISTSFLSSNNWDTTKIYISKEYFDKNESVLIETDLLVNHFAKPEHLLAYENWISSKIKNDFEEELVKMNGSTLWDKRKDIFPSLIFCEETRIQIIQHSASDDSFQQIKQKLLALELYFSNWKGNFDFTKLPFKTTPESESRSNILKEILTIQCPDGLLRKFNWHFRYTPGAGRCYFYPDAEILKCYIGFIGKKIS